MHAFAHHIVETVRHPLILLDGLLRVDSANAAYYRAFRTTRGETEGRLLYDLSGGQWDIPRLRALLDVIESEGGFEDFEVRLDSPRHGDRILLLNARRVVPDEGGMAMILLAIEDVTEKVQARDELQRLNRELENRVRERTAELVAVNQELEAFCYSVSHDLRAPLRALDGFSEELLRGYAECLDERGRHYLQRVRAGTQRMGTLIDDLLQLSRLSRGEIKRERVDLSEMAHMVAVELQQAEPDRLVSFDIQPDLTGEADAGLLKIALENLLGNAWKFTGQRSNATIAFGRTEHQGQPAFFVRDDGAGFDMNHSDKLFGAFQRLHSQREFPGNGIGLATIQRIIHRHGGQVWAESPPGMGATFYFTLPNEELV